MKVLLAAGGTAGHINPAIAIAKQFAEKENAEIQFIGTKRGMETELVTREGFPISYIEVAGFKRSLTLENVKIAWQAFQGIRQAGKLIRDFAPDLVVGCGGYVSGPVLFCAHLQNRPTLIHEQNVIPGLTTKILSKFVDKVAISFEDTTQYITKKKTVLTGNPIRKNIVKIAEEPSKKRAKPTVLVVGGSLGAKVINDTIAELVKDMEADIELVWASGKREYEDIKKRIDPLPPQVKLVPYIYDMAQAIAAADVVIARAGAITVSEICAAGKTSILIPSPNVTHNHQAYNAKALEKKGAAKVILEQDLTPRKLKETLLELLMNRELLQNMSQNAKKMGITNAAEKIHEIGLQLIQETPHHNT